jgi:hypothetical protein
VLCEILSHIRGSSDSAVDIAITLRSGKPRVPDLIPGRGLWFSVSNIPRPTLRPSQPLM